MIIGIDFGGVLSVHDSKATVDRVHQNVAIDMPGAIAGLTALKERGHRLYIISFCGKRRAQETAASLTESSAAALFDGMFFVKDKPHKKFICEHLGAHVMIDDNPYILSDIAKNARSSTIPVLFDDGDNFEKLGDTVFGGWHGKSWPEIVAVIDGFGATLPPRTGTVWRDVDVAKYTHAV